ncbi:DUF5985 family protein [Alsobacter sp. SYSU M60028]|uniref:DUF5985 family protein n=1 Tax=Alsobacter ponti TaxID=2962936 RepID=A0ABT1L7W1_9HYPH|nr:DUF5985 family protein [Alsobacter ponti]MCP8937151.1 DUF5985 family protein [Alsobacter ponti]
MSVAVPAVVYLLCLCTSAACAVLLVRGYRKNRTPLLLWSAVCFAFLALNNFFVVCDLLLFPEIDFMPLRQMSALAGVSVLLCGFVWTSD